MTARRPIGVFATALLMTAACNLAPSSQAIEGTLSGGVYAAPDGSFTVRVPHLDRYEQRWMNMKEVRGPDEFYVSFGPAALDTSIYRLSVVLRDLRQLQPADLENLAQQIGDAFGRKVEPMTGRAPRLVAQAPTTVGGDRAYSLSYDQEAPAGTMAESASVLHHEALIVLRGARMFTAWRQTNSIMRPHSQGLSLREFALSVKLQPAR